MRADELLAVARLADAADRAALADRYEEEGRDTSAALVRAWDLAVAQTLCRLAGLDRLHSPPGRYWHGWDLTATITLSAAAGLSGRSRRQRPKPAWRLAKAILDALLGWLTAHNLVERREHPVYGLEVRLTDR
jgi:hypothetical protein